MELEYYYACVVKQCTVANRIQNDMFFLHLIGRKATPCVYFNFVISPCTQSIQMLFRWAVASASICMS